MSFLDQPDNMFPINDVDGSLVIEDGYGFRVEKAGNRIAAGDLVHYEGGGIHRVWRLTGERGWRGSWRGVWPD